MKFSRLVLALSLAVTTLGTHAQGTAARAIKFGHLVQPGHPIASGAQKFAELVASKSEGKMKVSEFGASVLGSETQQVGALQGGVQEIFAPASTSLASLIKEFSLIDTPFAFTNTKQVDALLQGPFGQALLDKLPHKGLVGLGYWETGFRNVTNSRKPVASVEDMKGLKIRVIGNPLFLASFSAMGANPVPMAFAELFGALESRALDAQENPFSVVLTSKFFEVQKYMSVTNHVYTANPILVSKKFWDRLTPTEQKVLRDATTEAGNYHRALSREAAMKDRQALEAKGMQVNDVSSEAISKMRQLTAPIADKFAATYDPALVQLYRSEMQRIRATVN